MRIFLCMCILCAWVFLSTVLPWEFIYAKLHKILYNFKTRIAGEICWSDINVHKGYIKLIRWCLYTL